MIRALVASTMLLAGPALATSPDPRAGGELHQYGRWRDAPLSARIEGGPRLPPGRLACAGCHGVDRAGGNEGGVSAPPLLPGPRALPVLLPADETGDLLWRAVSRSAERHAGLRLQRMAVGDPLPPNLAEAGGMLLLARPPDAKLLAAVSPTSLVAGPLDLLADRAAAGETRGIWLLTDPRAAAPREGGALARHLRAATRLVELALEGAGRRLTRHRLLAALTRVELGGTVPLDYAAHPGRGSRMAEVLAVEPSRGRLRHHAPRAPMTADP